MEKFMISPTNQAKRIYFGFVYDAPMHSDNKQRAINHVTELIDSNPNEAQYWEDVLQELFKIKVV